MSENISEIRAAVRSILADHSSGEAVLASEAAGWNEQLWAVLEDRGFSTIAVDEAIGGAGGSVAEACALLHELGRAAASVPLAEHALLGGWLLSCVGREVPDGVVTVIDDTSRLVAEESTGGLIVSGEARHVAWLGASTNVLAIVEVDSAPMVLMLATDDLHVSPAVNLAQEQRGHIVADRVTVSSENLWPVSEGTAEQLRLRGALSRAALMGGALERTSEITVRYTGEREQFGRPIGRYQAVQRHLVLLAELAQQCVLASTVAALNAGSELDFFDTASAKIVAGEAATGGTAAAHQAHGAIGMTKEYELGQLSRRLWSWRDEYGHERAWSRELGRRLAEAGSDALWPRIATGMRPVI